MQSNVQTGMIVAVAAEDLTGMEDRIVEMMHTAGVRQVQLPTSNDARALGILKRGGAADANVDVLPLDPNQNFRVPLKDAVNPGDSVCLADVATAADKGKVRALPAAAGTYRVFMVAEEAGTDGGLGLVRPNGPETIVVT